jgi:predicted phosphoribosyltransferase
MEPALGGLNLADVDMEIANRVSFSAGRSVISELEAECDEMGLSCDAEPFYAVGPYCPDFSETSDQEVIALLGNP